MEHLAILAAVAAMIFGGPGFRRQKNSPPVGVALRSAPARFGLVRIIAAGVVAVIVLYHLVS